MAVGPPEEPDELAATAKETGESIYIGFLDTLLTGIAITIPLVVTLYILTIGLEFVNNALTPVIALLEWAGIIQWFESVHLIRFLINVGIYRYVIGVLTELITLTLLLGIVMVLGTVGRNQYGERAIGIFDLAITSIPGLGTVYRSFRRMGDVMLNEDAENFQDVKLVQCLDEDIYVLGFKTSDSPPTVEKTTGHEDMVAMFLPLAPNPVTGGFLTYVPESDVYDINMTIEEGVRSILTSGIATGEEASQMTERTMGDLSKIADIENLQDALRVEENTDENEHSEEPDE